jgi:hypothetical protein
MTEAQTTVEDFIYAYKDWLDAGAPQDQPFSRSDDLEQNLRMEMNKVMKGNPFVEECCTTLRNFYKSTGLNDPYFPFNSNSLEWMDEVINDKYHLNKRMITWITNITSA